MFLDCFDRLKVKRPYFFFRNAFSNSILYNSSVIKLKLKSDMLKKTENVLINHKIERPHERVVSQSFMYSKDLKAGQKQVSK